MNSQVFDSIQQWFDVYTRGFADEQGQLAFVFQIKVDHSRRVAEIMEGLARDMGLQDDDVRAAYILGLLHDAGRFSQYAEFHTYNDRQSVNHGIRGMEIMAAFQVLSAVAPDDRMRIEAGIRQHNDHHLPDNILPFVKMIRDADKLDICRTMIVMWESGELLKYPELMFGINMEGPPNPAAVAELRAGQTISYGHIKSMADFLMTLLSWVYDFNFFVSYRRLKEWRMIEKIVAALPSEAGVKQAAGIAARYYEQQLQKTASL